MATVTNEQVGEDEEDMYEDSVPCTSRTGSERGRSFVVGLKQDYL